MVRSKRPKKTVSTMPLFAPTEVEAVFGSLPFAGKPKTIEEMEAAVAAESQRAS